LKHILLIFTIFSVSSWTFGSSKKCRELILKNTCLVASDIKYESQKTYISNLASAQNQKCENGSDLYAKELYDLFPSLPEHSQKAFCHIKKIFIVPGDVDFGGKAQEHYDLKNIKFRINKHGKKEFGLKTDGFILSLSKLYRFDIKETAEEFANRGLQQSFGVNVRKNGLHPYFPKIKIKSKTTLSSLYTTLVHETGHFLDYSKEHTATFYYEGNFYDYQASAFTNIGWHFYQREDGSFLRSPFPNVEESLSPSARPYEAYNANFYIEALERSSFSSLYALNAPQEDFAEHYMHTVLDMDYSIWDGDVKLLSNSHRSSNEGFNAKTDYILKNLEAGFDNFENMPISWIPLNGKESAHQICKHPK